MKVARIYLRVMSFSEDDCTEYQESAALVDCSAVYRAALLQIVGGDKLIIPFC